MGAKVSTQQGQAAYGEQQALHDPAAGGMLAPLQGVVQSVYPLDDELNHAKVWFCDVQLFDGYGLLQKVWIARPAFHQETKKATRGQPVRRHRNPYEPWRENGTGGWHQSILPGDLVVVQFIAGYRHRAFISHFWPASGQGSTNDQPHGGDYPFNFQSRFRVKDGDLVEEVVKRLDAQVDQVPQWTWLYNGAFIEILNDGSLLVQSSVNRTPFIPEDVKEQGLRKSPTPTGDLVLSTRGAQQGDVVVTTGKSAKLDQTNARGNVLLLLVEAAQGNFVVNAQTSKQGNIIAQASKKNGGSQIFLRAASANDYLAIAGGTSELSADGTAILRSLIVKLGSSEADKHAVTYEELFTVFDFLWQQFDSHVHTDVQSGSSESGPPLIPLEPFFEQRAPEFKSEVVMLELSHKQTDAADPVVKVGNL